MKLNALNPILYRPIIQRALEEDLGRAGDLTTDALIPEHAMAEGAIVARQKGCIAGLETALTVFAMVGPGVVSERLVDDGATVAKGQTLAHLRGPARTLLTGERTALNLLGRLSGIATETRRLVDAVAGYPARITCTRKTTPGLRVLGKIRGSRGRRRQSSFRIR